MERYEITLATIVTTHTRIFECIHILVINEIIIIDKDPIIGAFNISNRSVILIFRSILRKRIQAPMNSATAVVNAAAFNPNNGIRIRFKMKLTIAEMQHVNSVIFSLPAGSIVIFPTHPPINEKASVIEKICNAITAP